MRVATVSLTVLGIAALFRIASFTLPGISPGSGERMQDFRDATYFPIREMWSRGGMPYDPDAMFAHWPVVQEFDLYLPAHLWLFGPLAIPDYRPAVYAMFALNALLLAGLALLAGHLARDIAPRYLVSSAVFAVLTLGQVGKAQLVLGQLNPLVALTAAGAYWTRSPRLASILLALAWLKPQFGLPLTVVLLFTGRRQVALMGTLIAFLASLPVVVVLVARAGGIGGFVDVLRRNVDYATRTGYGAADSPQAYRLDLASVVSRTLTTSLPGWVEPLFLLLALGAAVWVIRRTSRTAHDRGDVERKALLGLVCFAWIMVGVVHQPGDILLMAPFVAVLAAAVFRSRQSNRDRMLLVVALLSLSVPHVLLYFVATTITSNLGAYTEHLLPGWSVLVGTVLITAYALRARSARPDDAVAV